MQVPVYALVGLLLLQKWSPMILVLLALCRCVLCKTRNSAQEDHDYMLIVLLADLLITLMENIQLQIWLYLIRNKVLGKPTHERTTFNNYTGLVTLTMKSFVAFHDTGHHWWRNLSCHHAKAVYIPCLLWYSMLARVSNFILRFAVKHADQWKSFD